jgi:hypothetical protein
MIEVVAFKISFHSFPEQNVRKCEISERRKKDFLKFLSNSSQNVRGPENKEGDIDLSRQNVFAADHGVVVEVPYPTSVLEVCLWDSSTARDSLLRAAAFNPWRKMRTRKVSAAHCYVERFDWNSGGGSCSALLSILLDAWVCREQEKIQNSNRAIIDMLHILIHYRKSRHIQQLA